MVTIPNIKVRGGHTLYILGNGFDLCHDLLSRYSDFCVWLNKHGQNDFVTFMEEVFPLENNENTRWCNFEEALGESDVSMIFRDFFDEKDYLSMDMDRKIQEVVDNLESVVSKISPLMKKWAEDIFIPQDADKRRFLFNEKDWFLNFNYTSTLETLYNIPNEHICHIHGSVDSLDEVITGHNNVIPEDSFDDDDEVSIAKTKMVKLTNGLKKNQERNYEKHRSFFLSLSSVTDVVVIGHSLAPVDEFYFRKVVSKVIKGARWHFAIYKPIDHHRVFKFTQRMPTAWASDVVEFGLSS